MATPSFVGTITTITISFLNHATAAGWRIDRVNIAAMMFAEDCGELFLYI